MKTIAAIVVIGLVLLLIPAAVALIRWLMHDPFN
jgi:hypothetical protein